MIADTGSTGNFGAIASKCIINKRPTTNPIAVTNPNGSLMYSTHEAELDLPTLPPEARHCHLFPDLHVNFLVSIGQLCDADCVASFTKDDVQISYQNKIVLTGPRCPTTKLWMLEAVPEPTWHNVALSAIGSAKPADLVAFAHASLGSPALTTLDTALKKGFVPGFPGLSAKSLRKHPPQSVAMHKGHMDQGRQNQKSTKPKQPTAAPFSALATETDNDLFPTSPNGTTRTHFCYATVAEPAQATGQIFSDQTGQFILPSSQGSNYIMIVYDYDYDSNVIEAEPMKRRTGKAMSQQSTTKCAPKN